MFFAHVSLGGVGNENEWKRREGKYLYDVMRA
jgi:hypothetical protein